MAISWVSCSKMADEGSVKHACLAVRTHFGAGETEPSSVPVEVLADGAPSWRHGSRPQTVDLSQDLREQISGDGDFGQLECDVSAVADDLRANLD